MSVAKQAIADSRSQTRRRQSLFGEENSTKLEELEEAYKHYAADLSDEAGNGNLRWRDTGETEAIDARHAELYERYIALRIFSRVVRDTKRELSEKFEKIVSRKGKKSSRMERDDKRALAGAVQMRVYNIKRYSEMDAAELEAEYSAIVDRLENVEKNFAEDAGKGEVRSDIEDIRAEVANANAGKKLPSESARGIRGKSCILRLSYIANLSQIFAPKTSFSRSSGANSILFKSV